ncbi:uncharacterized protein LOC111232928 [Seriola dumerili]|uniref:uncharacterized protein LOC111232928 n=1 Tax=Seriola dumerili TaxID=41447 RepID=UPI000BBE662A|nr:uncharacterized protein LOC111232928 [Seriola dumerili]
MKMAGLCWVTVVLTFLLSAGDSVSAVDQNWLTSIVDGIKNEYALGDSFSVAVNVPENEDPNNLQQVLQDDPADQVKQAVSQGQVYQGTRVVAAAQSEAVSRVLENIQPFIKSSQGNFLIIYSAQSPCGPTCTNANEDGISNKINDVTQNWSGYAFAFSNVADVPNADTSQLAQSFQQLGISELGLDKIFRCYNPGDGAFQCTSCSSGGDVTPSCVANTALSNQEQGAGEETSPLEPVDTGIGGGSGERTGGGKPGRVCRSRGRGSRKGGCKRRGGSKVGRRCRRRGGCGRRWGGGKVGRRCRRRGGCGRRWGGGRQGSEEKW